MYIIKRADLYKLLVLAVVVFAACDFYYYGKLTEQTFRPVYNLLVYVVFLKLNSIYMDVHSWLMMVKNAPESLRDMLLPPQETNDDA